MDNNMVDFGALNKFQQSFGQTNNSLLNPTAPPTFNKPVAMQNQVKQMFDRTLGLNKDFNVVNIKVDGVEVEIPQPYLEDILSILQRDGKINIDGMNIFEGAFVVDLINIGLLEHPKSQVYPLCFQYDVVDHELLEELCRCYGTKKENTPGDGGLILNY